MSATMDLDEGQFRTILTDMEIASFADRGYHIHERLFSEEEIDEFIEHCELVVQGVYETTVPPDCVTWRPGEDATRIRDKQMVLAASGQWCRH